MGKAVYITKDEARYLLKKIEGELMDEKIFEKATLFNPVLEQLINKLEDVLLVGEKGEEVENV